jgi:hypothetical protein
VQCSVAAVQCSGRAAGGDRADRQVALDQSAAEPVIGKRWGADPTNQQPGRGGARPGGPSLHCTALHFTALHCTALHTGNSLQNNLAKRSCWCDSSAVHHRVLGGLLSAVQCSAVQCSAVQCCAVRCGAVLCSAVERNALVTSGTAELLHHYWK